MAKKQQSDDDLISLLQNRRKKDRKLKKDIVDRLSQRDKIYYVLEEAFGKRAKASDQELEDGLSKEAKTIEDTLKDILSNSKKGDLSNLKKQAARLEQIKDNIDAKTLDPREYERLNEHVVDMQSVISKDIAKKNSLFSKIRKTVSENAVDAGALLVGMTGNDPIAAFMVKVIGDKIRARRERKREEQEQLTSQLNVDAENLRKGIQPGEEPKSIPTPNFGGDESVSPTEQAKLTGQPVISLLELIGEQSIEMTDDIKKLVRIAEDQEQRYAADRLNSREAAFEAGLGKSGLPVGMSADGSQSGDNQRKGLLGTLLGSLGIPGGGRLLSLIGKYGLIIGAVGAVLYGAYDILSSYVETGSFGNSETEKLIFSINGKVLDMMKKLGPGAQWGAERGAFIPIIGPIVGGLFGMLVEGLTNIWDSGAIGRLVKTAGDMIGQGISYAVDAIKDAIFNILDGALAFVEDVPVIGKYVKQARRKLKTFFGKDSPGSSRPQVEEAQTVDLRDPEQRRQAGYDADKTYKEKLRTYEQVLGAPRAQNESDEQYAKRRDAFKAKKAELRRERRKGRVQENQQRSKNETDNLTRLSGRVDVPDELNSNDFDYSAYAQMVSSKESGGDYGAINQLGYLGKYQMGAMALIDAGLVKPGTSNRGLADDNNWLLKGGREAFLSDPILQENTMVEYTERNRKALKNLGVVTDNTDPSYLAGALMAAHLKGPGGARDLLKGGIDSTDANGTKASTYLAYGKQSQAESFKTASGSPIPSTLPAARPVSPMNGGESNGTRLAMQQQNVDIMRAQQQSAGASNLNVNNQTRIVGGGAGGDDKARGPIGTTNANGSWAGPALGRG